MDKKYTFEELRDIIRTLRSENGCPWDRRQTHESLIPCMLEEAEEVVQGIHILAEENDAENLCEELGDVLLQVLLHSQIAEEEGLFTLDDVIQGLSEKMVRRHPHVFGSANADSPESALLSWEEVKRREKEEKAARKKALRAGENP